MDWLKTKLHDLANWITSFTPKQFWWSYPLGTFLFSIFLASSIYFIVDAFDKAHMLPEDPGMLLISLFLTVWIIVMILIASLIFTFSENIPYLILDNRLDSLKNSGLISKANSRIWLIGLSLYPFADQGWFKIFEDKIKVGVKVKILIYNPDTEFANKRDSSLPGNNSLAEDINDAIKKFTAFREKIKSSYPTISDNFEVRLYTGNASMSAFMIDNEVRVGLYMNNSTGLTAPELRIVNKGKQINIFSRIESHFLSVWNESSEL